MSVSLVPANLVDTVWPHIADGFQRASARSGGDLTVGDLWGGCRSGYCFLFVVQDEAGVIVAATVWKPEKWGAGQIFRCLALYGRGVRAWKDALRENVARIGRLCGCSELVADGREGWKAIFPEAKVVRVTYRMAI